ncbi:MAG: OsmC family protein [Candidatus Omnitrophota bacterium]|nr:MAG: OsmC family protein [Candidatus Omnitrophota bacterium]
METRVKVEFLEGDRFEAITYPSELKLYVDKEKDDYSPQGPNPLELFLTAFSGCIGVYAKRYLNRHSIEFTKLTVSAKGELSSEAPIRLINIEIEVYTNAQFQPEEKDIFLKFIENCPIHNTILHTKNVNIIVN